MDPISVLSLVEACAGLAVTAGKLAIGLKKLADNYKKSNLTFRSLSSQCRLFATAVRAIQAWMEEAPDTDNVDDRIWEQLADSLECANDAIYALENELVNTSSSSINTFWDKINVVWNLDTMKELEDCIHKQICSLSVILQIMNLPTRQSQTNSLEEKASVFHDSRSSAISLRDPETSTIRGGGDGVSTIRPTSTVMTSISQMPHFDFEEMLLTSQVYLRNRNKTLALHSKPTGTGKMRDAEASVSELDLPPKSGDIWNLQSANELVSAGDIYGLRKFLIENLIPQHEELNRKYQKVKRYFFERDDQVRRLQSQIEIFESRESVECPPTSEHPMSVNEALKTGDWQAVPSFTEQQNRISNLLDENARLCAQNVQLSRLKAESDDNDEVQKLRSQVDWYKTMLSYREGSSTFAQTASSARSEDSGYSSTSPTMN